MKKLFLPFATAIVLTTSCQQAPDAAKAETADKQEAAAGSAAAATYKVDVATSNVAWIGTKPVGQHNGDFKLASGEVAVENGTVVGGNFIIDINSIKDYDLEGEYNEKLVGHLKSEDFLHAEKHPTAKFEITKVEALQNDTAATHKISGNLTLRDSTKNVTFPAKINVTDTDLSAKATFNIDRTQWGLHYNSNQSLGDKFIRPEVNLTLNINAKK